MLRPLGLLALRVENTGGPKRPPVPPKIELNRLPSCCCQCHPAATCYLKATLTPTLETEAHGRLIEWKHCRSQGLLES